MSVTAHQSRTVFRACVVHAVRGGEALMGQLVQVAKGALEREESFTRDIQQRALVGDAWRLLKQHEPSLVKAYPMALLEIFAQGPSKSGARTVTDTGMDFGELSLMDETEMQDQVELSRAQQLAAHATDAVLAELNTLVSSAQGLRSVQPERNPLRPENYIRALLRVVAETGVEPPVRQLWMEHMREVLGQLLVTEYKSAAANLREHGIEPVGYAVLGMPSGGRSGSGALNPSNGYSGGYSTGYGGHSLGAPVSAHGAPAAYGGRGVDGFAGWQGDSLQAPISSAAEEALLTVGILRQMLAGGSGWHDPGVAPVVYAAPYVGPVDDPAYSPVVAIEVVGRMMDNIAQDRRLLAPVQHAVQNLEPAIKQLVQHDGRFFTDEAHPARKLLDELTQRSLAFKTESAEGFDQFMRLLNEAVGHLAATNIHDAGPFDTVLKALQAAWDSQEQRTKSQHDGKAKILLQTEQREMLADKIAADIRKLPDLEQVPADILDFVTGPWADVVALAQVTQPEGLNGSEGDPGGYLALVPLLLWSAQPVLTRAEPDRLTKAIPGILAKVRAGLKTIQHPPTQASSFMQRLVGLHQAAFEKPAQAPVVVQPEPPSEIEPEPASHEAPPTDELPVAAVAATEPPDSALAAPVDDSLYAEFVVGVWVELITNRRAVRTQLTWASPRGTLFLFTAADGSTQSMTRRMRDKLASEGSLRVLPGAPQAARTPDAKVATLQAKRPGQTR